MSRDVYIRKDMADELAEALDFLVDEYELASWGPTLHSIVKARAALTKYRETKVIAKNIKGELTEWDRVKEYSITLSDTPEAET